MEATYVSSVRQQRLSTILAVFFVIWCGFIARTSYLQIFEADSANKKIKEQSVRREMILPNRGRIIDFSGTIIADNASVGKDTILMKSLRLPRIHPYGFLAGQVLGRLGTELDAQMGLEYHLDEDLRGREGWQTIRIDARKRTYDGSTVVGEQPRPGVDVVLNIDKDIQQIAETALEKGVHKVQADKGCAIVVNPHTGQIVAIANYPFFDPDNLSAENANEARNEIIGKVYEPGSVYKIITGTAALEEKKVNPHDLFDGEQGRITLNGGDVIKDTHPYGLLTFSQAMAVSSNIVFLKVGQRIGRNTLFKYSRAFGFGMPTGIELPGEEKGRLKPLIEWGSRTLETMSFGHEILVTPIQVAMAVSAVANGGILYKPHLVKEFRDPRTHKVLEEFKPIKIRRVMSEETAATMRQMLKGVVDSGGTANNLKTEGLTFAGKTGTAEKYDIKTGRYDRGSMNSSFVGMFPAEHPEFVIYVVIDQPRTVTVGGLTAGPVFKDIATNIYKNHAILVRHKRIDTTLTPEVKVAQAGINLDSIHQNTLDSDLVKLSQKTPKNHIPRVIGWPLQKAMSLLTLKGYSVSYSGFGWVQKIDWIDPKKNQVLLTLSNTINSTPIVKTSLAQENTQ
jgi:cell division protein FtsI (penicillin-binding protein 3)